MVNKEQILKTARALVQSRGLEMKIYGLSEEEESLVIYFTSQKRVPLKDFARDLEFEFNLPIVLKQIPKKELGKIGQTKVLSESLCCAATLRSCPFQHTYGCGYGFEDRVSKKEAGSDKKEPASGKIGEAPPKPKKKRKKIIRRLLIG